MAERMPALFFGHGNPMNALLVNPYIEQWAALGAGLRKPKAILSVSAHSYIQDAAVMASAVVRALQAHWYREVGFSGRNRSVNGAGAPQGSPKSMRKMAYR